MTIVEFLEARLAEDERFAVDRQHPTTVTGFLAARMLREVEAKRAIIAECGPISADCDDAYNLAMDVLYAMTSVYADHPDYDPAWVPSSAAV